MKTATQVMFAVWALVQVPARAGDVQQWEVLEASFESRKAHTNPFTDVEVNVVFRSGEKQWVIPAFWAGGSKWTVRFAPPAQGRYQFHVECSDPSDAGLNGHERTLRVTAYRGGNPLLKHGFLRVSADKRHFEHADGEPFFWLGDTWWKGLCKRLTWEGFQELTADRKAKGFTVVQIVCGVYPDEGPFEPRWENEGGKPYLTRDFSVVNCRYFEYADRRMRHLVDAGIVPAIVGGWGRRDCDAMAMAGVAGMKRHWRNLIARYGAYPAIWIIGGESGGPQWTEVARYVKRTDPYHHPATMHPFDSARNRVTDETVIDFDMLQTGHGGWPAAKTVIPKLKAARDRHPAMPVVIGEHSYEQHMQTGFADVQRHVFWSSMLSGSAGLTYGAAGVWHASVDGDPGLANTYDFTTWKEGMHFAGSTQLGRGKRLLEQYPWWRFEPHPEWANKGCFAAGIPGEVRFIYLPRRNVYNWAGLTVKQLERNVPYRAFYFDPVRGKRFDLGKVVSAGPPPRPFEGPTRPLLYQDRFQGTGVEAWKDYGTPTHRTNGLLVGGKGMVTILEKVNDKDLMASAEANSNAEAGVILRFHDPDNYLVALYSPLMKSIFLHDRRAGQWGGFLGRVAVPEIGPKIRLAAAACGDQAAMVLTDRKKTYYTDVVKVRNTKAGRVGLWLFQIGERQEFDNFKVSKASFSWPEREAEQKASRASAPDATRVRLRSDQWLTPNVPSPQDWVLVLEKVER